MPLFQCAQCGCVENSALANYWQRTSERLPLLCSACDPTIARWHNRFPQRSAVGMLVDAAGHLWHPRQLMQMPQGAEIVGIVQQKEMSDVA